MEAQQTASKERGKPTWRAFLLLFLGAWAWRSYVVVQYEELHPQAERPIIDEASYDAWAQRIAAGDWLGQEIFFQEPLYPYSLAVVYAVFGVDRTAVRLLQALAGALTVLGVALLGTRLFGRRAGWLGGLVYALHQPAIAMAAYLLKPNLFLPLWVLLAYLLAGRPRSKVQWLAVGVLTGLGALLRGNMLMLSPWLVLWPWLVRSPGMSTGLRRAGASLAVLVGLSVPLGTVAWRNASVGGAWVLTTSGAGTNVYGGNNAQNPYGVAREFDWVRGIPEHEAGDWRREAERRTGRSLQPDEVSSFWLAETGRSLLENPLLHLRIFWNKLRLTLGAYEVPDNHLLDWDARYVPSLRVPTGGFAIWGSLGLAGIGWLLSERRRSAFRAFERAWPIAFLGLLYLGTIVLTVTSARVRLALMPLLAPFAGYWLMEAWRLRSVRVGTALRLIPITFLVSFLVRVPVLDRGQRAADWAERDYNLATQWLEDGRLDEGWHLVEMLREDYPSSQRLRTLQASYAWMQYLEEGSDTGAGLEQAWGWVFPPSGNRRERYDADVLAGWIALERGQPQVAWERFESARDFNREDPEVTLAQLRAAARWYTPQGVFPAAAQAELRELSSRRGEMGARAGVLAAEVEFAVAAFVLAGDGLDEGEREQAQGRVRLALKRLRSIAEGAGVSGGVKAAAWVAAARMQVHPVLANPEAARGLLERALELDPGSSGARGLVEELGG